MRFTEFFLAVKRLNRLYLVFQYAVGFYIAFYRVLQDTDGFILRITEFYRVVLNQIRFLPGFTGFFRDVRVTRRRSWRGGGEGEVMGGGGVNYGAIIRADLVMQIRSLPICDRLPISRLDRFSGTVERVVPSFVAFYWVLPVFFSSRFPVDWPL